MKTDYNYNTIRNLIFIVIAMCMSFVCAQITANAQRNGQVKEFIGNIKYKQKNLIIGKEFKSETRVRKISEDTYVYQIKHEDIFIIFTMKDVRETLRGIEELKRSKGSGMYICSNEFTIGKNVIDGDVYYFMTLHYTRSKKFYMIEDIESFEDDILHIGDVLFRYNKESWRKYY